MKIYAYLAALALLAGVVGYGVHIVKKANRVDAAEARAEAAEKGRKDDMAEVVRRLDADAKQRGELLARMGGIEQRFADIKIPDPKVLVQTREVPGACPVTGVSSEFLRLYNQASEP
jgi:hypothetical protein